MATRSLNRRRRDWPDRQDGLHPPQGQQGVGISGLPAWVGTLSLWQSAAPGPATIQAPTATSPHARCAPARGLWPPFVQTESDQCPFQNALQDPDCGKGADPCTLCSLNLRSRPNARLLGYAQRAPAHSAILNNSGIKTLGFFYKNITVLLQCVLRG